MLILPAIDILGGRCVRLTQGDYSCETVYDSDPVTVAQRFERGGASWLHVVDLDGAKEGRPVNLDVVKRICEAVSMRVEFGGGIRSLDLAHEALAAGVERVIVGTRLVQDLAIAEQLFCSLGERVVAGIDTKDGKVAVHGWTEASGYEGVEFAKKMEKLGCRRVIFTDVATDGALVGPNLEATREMVYSLSIPVIASGGVSNLSDISDLATLGVEGAIVGKAIYERRLTLEDAIRVASD